jgi:hypothetical protein
MSQIFMGKLLGLDKRAQFLSGPSDLDHVSAHMLPDELLGFAFYEDQAMINDDEPVTQLRGLLHVMRGQENGNAPFSELFEPVPYLVPGLRVEAGRGFIQDQKVRIIDEGTSQNEATHQSAREFGYGCIQAMIEGDKGKKLHGLLPSDLFGDIEIPGKNLQILKDGQIRIKTVFLLADTNAGFDLAPIPGDIKAENLKASARHRRETIDHPDGGGLPRTIRTQNPKAFTGRYPERDAIDCDKIAKFLQ